MLHPRVVMLVSLAVRILIGILCRITGIPISPDRSRDGQCDTVPQTAPASIPVSLRFAASYSAPPDKWIIPK